jgi:hypothetical protein
VAKPARDQDQIQCRQQPDRWTAQKGPEAVGADEAEQTEKRVAEVAGVECRKRDAFLERECNELVESPVESEVCLVEQPRSSNPLESQSQMRRPYWACVGSSLVTP